MNFLLVFFGLGMGFVFTVIWTQDFMEAYRESGNFSNFLKSKKARETVYFIAAIFIPILLVNMRPWGGILEPMQDWALPAFSVLFSFGISWFWYTYVNSLDMFEKEPIQYIILTFVLACGSVFLVYPISDALHFMGFKLNGDPWNDWWYCVFGIGLVEEIVKILPFLIVLRFTKEINEPFDYILYGSVAALGFAFVENIMYLNDWNLRSILARTLYSSLAHMFDTCLITYALAIAHYRNPKWKWAAFPVMLLVASLAHGFYDFWLINDAMHTPWVTIVFFLISMQIWMTMKNNLVNISPYYTNDLLKLEKGLKYRLVNGLITLFYLAYIAIFLLYNKHEANDYLANAWQQNIYVFLFIAINFGAHEVIPGYTEPLLFSERPLRMLLPRFFAVRTKTGAPLVFGKLLSSRRGVGLASFELSRSIPMTGQLGRRVIFNGDNDCYLFVLDKPMVFNGEMLSSRLLIANASRDHNIIDRAPHPIRVYSIHREAKKMNGTIKMEDVKILATVLAHRPT